MEGPVSTTTENTTGKHGKMDQMVLMTSKPLHRFVQKEPKSLGIVIVIFGCAELLMGIHLASGTILTSSTIYIPFWQGLLFLVCGSLSIYTELHPSKKMVTVCLAMYVVSLFGIIVSTGFRIYSFSEYSYLSHNHWRDDTYYLNVVVFGVEGILCTSALCVSVILIFLCAVARLALRSTHTQVIVKHIVAPQSDATLN